ncbi:hypothetical protein PGT21_015103 [Puccinia graminis f. sp. tritici]|uniref:Uncharacterized protein n=1 Tax=Puccinia graminis f. sp. tritici TaxID=56615 RepID=A0A5B0LMP2_PUCGR|nr:hypothetical protein PGT21_015103 [Puccinia graminis f. sp. tritici]
MLCKKLSLIFIIPFLQIGICTPVGPGEFLSDEIKGGRDANDLPRFNSKDSCKPQGDSKQQEDWDSMIKSVKNMENDYVKTKMHEFEYIDCNIIKESIDALNSCHNQIEHVFGSPTLRKTWAHPGIQEARTSSSTGGSK